jgi:hypothetical protein
MRNELLGYLLGALETDEQARVENGISNDRGLRRDFELLRRSLAPLEADSQQFEPPRGLAQRTVDFVFLQVALQTPGPAPNEPSVGLPEPAWSDRPMATPRWRLVDFSVAAGILVAAIAVVVPAIIKSRDNARLFACQNRLQTVYPALAQFADMNNSLLPVAKPVQGFEGKAGVYAPLLLEAGYLNEPELVVCPGSDLGEAQFRIPRISELRAATGPELDRLVKMMGGSYAFAIGYRENGKYQPLRMRLGKNSFPLMADLPGHNGKPIGHHGSCGRNVLTADGRVFYINTCCRPGTHDRLYLNDDGRVDAGNGRSDCVLSPSDLGPSFGE